MGGAAMSPMGRDEFVLNGAAIFINAMHNKFLGSAGVESFESFLAGIESRMHIANSEYTTYLVRVFAKAEVWKQEAALTKHSNHAREISASITSLKANVAALKADRDNPRLRLECLSLVAYLRGQCEAMEDLIL